MKVPVGFLETLWRFLSFLPFFFLLFALGLVKAAIICPFAVLIIFIGNSAVILGLWLAHFIWSYYCVIKAQRLGLVLKILLLLSLPIPLLLWPVLGIVGSLLVGVGYGIFTPLIATFEPVGEHVVDKFFHCFADGCWSTIKGSCTIVRDFTDICFHSYFSYMDELSEKVAEDEIPLDIKLSRLPSSLLVSLLAIPIDVPLITAIALWKSPCMLFRGWQRLFHDLIGREGPFLETVCVPFAGLAIILWPLAVVGAVISAFICSFFLGLYGGVVVHQEDSLLMGLAYIISVISLFDEYANDLLYLREGSCFPRLVYRKSRDPPSGLLDRRQSVSSEKEHTGKAGPSGSKLFSERSRTLRRVIQQLKPMQLWDWLFRSCELNGRILLRDGLINLGDIEECIVTGKSKELQIMLPAYCILQCLLRSAHSDSPGLLITDEVELTKFNWPKDRVFEWFLGPLLVMKEQIKRLQLDENEEACLCKLMMIANNQKPEDWNGMGFPSDDTVRMAQLQSIFRRLQGIVSSMSRLPTFRRRFRNLVNVLYMEAMRTYGVSSQSEGSSKLKVRKSKSMNFDEKLDPEASKLGGKFRRSSNWAEKQNDEAAENNVEDRQIEGITVV